MRFLGVYAVTVPLLVAGAALASGDQTEVIQITAEKIPVISLVILFSSSVLAGSAAIFWRIFREQANTLRLAITTNEAHAAAATAQAAATASQAAATAELRTVLDRIDRRLG